MTLQSKAALSGHASGESLYRRLRSVTLHYHLIRQIQKVFGH
jgi:hypothetical protein